MSSALSELSDTNAFEIIKARMGPQFNDKDIVTLLKNARECPALMERVRLENSAGTQHTTQTNQLPVSVRD